jgi:hypothetical protein
MKLRTIFHWAVVAAAVAMLFVAAQLVLFLLSLDRSSFQTEGSPAGTGLFVLALAAPFGALFLGIGGLMLLWRSARRLREAPDVVTIVPPAASAAAPAPEELRREERWHRHARGSRLGVLLNGERAALLYLPPGDVPAWHSHRPGPHRDGTSTHPFRCADDGLVLLPVEWTVFAGQATLALEQFEHDGEAPAAVDWQPLRSVADALTPLERRGTPSGERIWEAYLQAV